MNDHVLAKLEFFEVLQRLSRECQFSVAAERALALRPDDERSLVARSLDLTAEAVDLLTTFPEVGIGGARDVRGQAERAEKGARLQPHELQLVQDMLAASRNLRRAFLRLPGVDDRFPELARYIDGIIEQTNLETDIGRSIGPRGDVLDTASPTLAHIRREVRIAQSRLAERLNALVTGGKYATALQDAIVTSRDGRYVVPVRAEARGAVPGVVHDTSASGQTIFVEPFEIVELNNKWRERQLEEQHEVDRILDALSAAVGAKAGALRAMVEAVARFDLAMAKARLAFAMRASRPHLHEPAVSPDPNGHPTHEIRLVRARHPLLDPATVVPTNLDLGEHFRVLLVTGPNTGGKTVALKTVGLLTVMAQSGLFLPADDTSVVSVVPTIFADIGDEQSIAQSLSTFSAHMRTVIGMLREVTSESLVLLDELGAGTDPQEGSALARALISDLLERGPLVIATTHYSEVKAYAYATPGVENASVEFDVQTLAPTYRLMVGVPGRSNALAIARRLGMPESIIEAASGLVDPDEVRAESLLLDIRARREEADAALARARQTEQDTRQLRRVAARAVRDAELQRVEAREQALAEAEAELAEVRETLKRLQRDRDTVAATREHLEQRRQEVTRASDRVRTFRRERLAKPALPAGGRAVSVGDRVRVVALGQEGEVLAVSDGIADVQMGSLKTRQPVEALERLGRAQAVPQERVTVRVASRAVPSVELDLRGYRAAEVVEMLDQYLDEAYESGLPFVRIIHGKGTGTLRQVVRDVLQQHPGVAEHELAPPEQGGDGATVALMREG